MLKGFANFLVKELKELIRDPKIFLGMIIVPLVLFPVLGAIMSFSMQSAQESAEKTVVLVVNHDLGSGSSQFLSWLNSTLHVYTVDASRVEDALPLLDDYNATEIIEIPEDFTANMTSKIAATVGFYSVFSGSGFTEGAGSSIIDMLTAQFNRALAPDLVVPSKAVIIKGEIVKGIDIRTLGALLISQAIVMPVTIMILLSYSMQIAATSVAMEKEEKTLETLLTLPIDRFAILMGKLSGSIMVAALGAIAYMIGFNFYMGSFSASISGSGGVDLVSLGLVPSVLGYLLLGLSLFATLLLALALAVIVSAFAEDVRGAQAIVGNIYPLVFIPSLLLMYLDINSLPLAVKAVILAIPFSHPVVASKAVTMGDYLTAGLGIIYVTALTLIILYIASRLFATEKILTAKLKFRGLRKRRKASIEDS